MRVDDSKAGVWYDGTGVPWVIPHIFGDILRAENFGKHFPPSLQGMERLYAVWLTVDNLGGQREQKI